MSLVIQQINCSPEVAWVASTNYNSPWTKWRLTAFWVSWQTCSAIGQPSPVFEKISGWKLLFSIEPLSQCIHLAAMWAVLGNNGRVGWASCSSSGEAVKLVQHPADLSCPLTVIIHTAVASRVRSGAAELLPAGDPLGCSLAVLFSVHLRGRVICTFLERPCLLICLKYRQIGHAFLPFWSTFMLKQRIQMTCQ